MVSRYITAYAVLHDSAEKVYKGKQFENPRTGQVYEFSTFPTNQKFMSARNIKTGELESIKLQDWWNFVLVSKPKRK